MPSIGERRKWNALVDELFELDEQHPYLGQTAEEDEAPEPYVLGGAGSGNFGHAGRPGEQGGSSEREVLYIGPNSSQERVIGLMPAKVHFYHGTASSALASVKKNGLISKRQPGGDEWAAEHLGRDFSAEVDYSEAVINGRKTSVFITTNPSIATNFAVYATTLHPGTKPIVLEVALPGEKAIYRDEAGGALDNSAGNAMFRFEGTIPPAWIKGYHELKRVDPDESLYGESHDMGPLKHLAGNRTVYIVFLVKEDEPRAAAGEAEGHPFHGNQWTGGQAKREKAVLAEMKKDIAQSQVRAIKERAKNVKEYGPGAARWEDSTLPFEEWDATNIDEYIDHVNRRLELSMKNASPFIRMNIGDLQKVLSSKEVLNAFDSRHSHGGTTVDGSMALGRRTHVEEKLFGIPKDAPGKDRPKYGYLSSGDGITEMGRGMLMGAGGVAVKFKDHVLDHTTFTIGDSLDQAVTLVPEGLGGGWMENKPFLPQPVRRPNILAAPSGFIESRHRDGDEFTGEGKGKKTTRVEHLSADYVEAQIHGRLSIHDIESVTFASKPALATVARLKKHRIPYKVVSAAKRRMLAGEGEGHPFHGNQWTEGGTVAKNVTEEEAYALSLWQTQGSGTPFEEEDDFINSLLRRREDVPEAQHLDALIARTSAPTDLTLYRDVSPAQFKRLSKLTRTTDRGYVATTSDPAPGAPDDMRITVRLPKGFPVLDVANTLGENNVYDESEMLLPRGTTFYIRKDPTGGLILEPKLKTLAGEGEGHPFHGNQWTGSVGGGWTKHDQTSGILGNTIIGDEPGIEAVKNALTKIPKNIRDEAPKATFHAYDTPEEVTEKIDEYLMKHYGISSSGQAVGMVDREREQVFSLGEDDAVLQGFAHLLEARIANHDWQKATPGRTDEQRENDFVNAFAGLIMGRHGQDVMKFTNPLSAIIESKPVEAVLKKWRWAEDGAA